MLAHLLHRPVGVEENFLIPGDVGIAENGAGRLALVARPGRVKSVALKLHGQGDRQESPLGLGALFGSHIQQRDQKLQQVPGEEPDVPGHLQPAQGVIFQQPLGHGFQLLLVHRLSDESRVLLQQFSQKIGPAFAVGAPPAGLPGEHLAAVSCVRPQLVILCLRGFRQPLAGVLFRAVLPAVR